MATINSLTIVLQTVQNIQSFTFCPRWRHFEKKSILGMCKDYFLMYVILYCCVIKYYSYLKNHRKF